VKVWVLLGGDEIGKNGLSKGQKKKVGGQKDTKCYHAGGPSCLVGNPGTGQEVPTMRANGEKSFWFDITRSPFFRRGGGETEELHVETERRGGGK